jgi:hypothetical protein
MLLEDLLVALDDQYRLVAEANGDGQLLARLWQYVCRLRRDPRTRAVIEELLDEARSVDNARRASYARHTVQIRELLDRLERDCPDLFVGPEPEDDLAYETSHYKVRRLAEQAPTTDKRIEDLDANRAIAIAREYLKAAGTERVPADSPLFVELQDMERAEKLTRRAWRVGRTNAAAACEDMMKLLAPLDRRTSTGSTSSHPRW